MDSSQIRGLQPVPMRGAASVNLCQRLHLHGLQTAESEINNAHLQRQKERPRGSPGQSLGHSL